MPDDLYDRDFLLWTEQQAALLRRLAHGERVNAAIDWPHVIEEIEDVGRSQVSGCESLLRQAILHLIKLAVGEDRPAGHWRSEVAGFLVDAQERFSPSMRQHIDVDALYRKAVRQLRAGEYGTLLEGMPQTCPVTLDELLSDTLDVSALEARFRAPA